jgi:VWFA-related protein
MRANIVSLLLALAVAGAPLSAQQATFSGSVEVRVVNVDVVVLDRDGNPVTGLGRDDFELLEDGKPVPISNFLAYQEPAPGTSAAATPETPGAAPPAAPREPEIEVAPAATWVVYLDIARLEPGPRADVLRQLRDFLGRARRPGDRFLIAYFDGNSLQLLSPLTTQPATADAAIEKLQKRRGNLSRLESERAFLKESIANVNLSENGAAYEADQILDDINHLAEQEIIASHFEVSAARDLLSILSGVEGRVAILYAGAGIETRPAESLYELWKNKFAQLLGRSEVERQAEQRIDPRWTRMLDEYNDLLVAANGGRFTLYTIQAGRNRGPDVSAETPGELGYENPVGGDASGLREGSSLAALAAETGGRTFVASPKLGERLQAVRRDLVTYYSLGYHPEGEKPGRKRHIDVRVHRPGLRVLHRAEVSDRSWKDQATDATVTALLADSTPENPFGVSIATPAPDPKQSSRGRARLQPVEVLVPLHGITLLPGDGSHKGELLFEFALRDSEGGFRRLESRTLPLQIPDADLKKALGEHVSYKIQLALTPGKYTFATTVLDQLGGGRSTAIAPLDVKKR